jgi:hypothetical protein
MLLYIDIIQIFLYILSLFSKEWLFMISVVLNCSNDARDTSRYVFSGDGRLFLYDASWEEATLVLDPYATAATRNRGQLQQIESITTLVRCDYYAAPLLLGGVGRWKRQEATYGEVADTNWWRDGHYAKGLLIAWTGQNCASKENMRPSVKDDDNVLTFTNHLKLVLSYRWSFFNVKNIMIKDPADNY